MKNKQTFGKSAAKHLQKLEMYVPVVARVHGKSHPEFYEVHKISDVILEKIKLSGASLPELGEEFARLREITKDYTVPEDVCESYEAVYAMLEELDRAYSA